jgi:hypothetical protein
MEAPKCRDCGERHWPRQPCRAKDKSNLPKITIGPPITIEDVAEIISRGAEIGVSDSLKPTFDRVAYQREYMKKWRAAKKASDQEQRDNQIQVRSGSKLEKP